MPRADRPPRRRPSLWERVKRLLGRWNPPTPFEPPDEEPALVPTGPPRRPRPSSAVSLELPVEPEDVDARARSVDDDDTDGRLGVAGTP